MSSGLPSRPTVGVIGMLAWDQILTVDSYPQAGEYRIVRQTLEQSGGTSGNLAAALARLGVDVALAASVGDDRDGQRLCDELAATGCDIHHVRPRPGEPTDRSVIVVSGSGASSDRTILWQQGARLKHGDPLPIEEFFAKDLVVLDVDDAKLLRFLVDLPIHVSPRTRLLGTLTYLVENSPAHGLDLAARHDYIAGNEREICYLTERETLDAAVARLQQAMALSQARFAVISRGTRGCVAVTPDNALAVPAFVVEARDPTGAGDAFAAGIAFGVLHGWRVERIARFANGMGALATRALGARASLPDRSEIDAFLATAKTVEVT